MFQSDRRDSARILYHTSLPVLFGVKKYADALWEVVNQRGIEVNTRSNLVEVDSANRVAYFQDLDDEAKQPTPVEVKL